MRQREKRMEGTEGKEWVDSCYRANTMFLKHNERPKKGQVHRCCGSGREKTRGRGGWRDLFLTVFLRHSFLKQTPLFLSISSFLFMRRTKSPLALCFLPAYVCLHVIVAAALCHMYWFTSGSRPRILWEYCGCVWLHIQTHNYTTELEFKLSAEFLNCNSHSQKKNNDISYNCADASVSLMLFGGHQHRVLIVWKKRNWG